MVTTLLFATAPLVLASSAFTLMVAEPARNCGKRPVERKSRSNSSQVEHLAPDPRQRGSKSR